MKQQDVDIILVRPGEQSMRAFKKIGAVQHPMNLVYLATWLREHGHTSEIADLEVEPFSHLEERLKLARPSLVGISAITPNIPEAKSICVFAHSLGVKTVLGGVHPTVMPNETLQDTGCDYVVIGEGEKPLDNLLRAIKEGHPIESIKGIAFWRNGLPVVNKRPELINLDELPLPDRRFLKLDLYRGETTPGVLGRAATVFTSRGCPYACTFCASNVVNRGRIRFRSMEKIFDEIEDIAALGFKHLTVEDDTFTLRSDRVREFCQYLYRKHPQLSWDCDSRVDTVDDELLSLMKVSNCKKIAFGVESGSPRVLKSINKNIDINQVKDAFRLTKRHKILSQAFFMIGFPEETSQDVAATIELISEIKPDFLFVSVAVPYPGTALHDYMSRRGFLAIRDWGSFVFFGDNVPWHTEHFSSDDLVRIRKKISRDFYFRPSYILTRLLRVRNLREMLYLIRGAVVAFKSFSPSLSGMTRRWMLRKPAKSEGKW